MKRAYFILMIVLLGTVVNLAQKKIPSNPFGFEMDEPVGWYPIDKKLLEDNLNRFDLTRTTVEQFLDESKGHQLLFAYTKFEQDSFTGVNPKIEARVIRIRSSRPLTFSEFKPLAEATLRKIAATFDEQRYLVEPSEIKIGSIKSVYHISEFSLKTLNGKPYRVRSRTYLIPKGTYFFQISFVDEAETNGVSDEFNELIKSVKIRD